jgi:hypothetical protein
VASPPGAPSPPWWQSRMTLALNWLNSWRRPPNPGVSPGFLETRQWALDYNPAEGNDYGLALEYAEKRYGEMQDLSEALDKKLDDLARTSLAIGVLIATVAKVLGADTPLGRSPWLVWAVISFALSVLVAVWSRNPIAYGTPMEIRGLLKVMDDHPELTRDKTEALIASSYHVAVVGTYATNGWKARQLWRATSLLLIGIVLLIGVLVTSGQSATSPTEGKAGGGGILPEAGAAQRTRARSSVEPSRSD